MGISLLARSNELFRHHVIRRGRFRLYLAYSSFASWVPEAYPDFFCIGAPRAATTWVHKRLGRHPDVFIPRVKEVHFFDEPMEVDAPHRLVGPVPNRIFFDMNSPSHWRWYSLHYCRAGTRVKGDVTPEYSIISRRRIELIAERMPALKLIYILRNPVERAWSDACRPFMFKAPRVLRRPETLAEIRKEVMHPMMLKHGDYRAVIENWESLFDRSRILYLFFEDVAEKPREQLVRICRHLGLAPEGLPDEKLDGRKENVAPKFSIPEDIRTSLIEKYLPQKSFLEERFQRDLSGWYGPGDFPQEGNEREGR
jgi:hypothetical protein